MVTPKYEEYSPEEMLRRLRAERARGRSTPPRRIELWRKVLLTDPEPWTMLAEVEDGSIVCIVIITDYPAGPVSLILTGDRVALEFADGKTVTWSGADLPPAGDELVDLACRGLEHLEPTGSASLPAEGRVKLFVRTTQALLGAETSEADLLAGRHPLAALYRAVLRAESAVLDASP